MPNSPGFRVSAAFITDTYGKKQRDRPPAREVGRRESARMDFEDRQGRARNSKMGQGAALAVESFVIDWSPPLNHSVMITQSIDL